MTATIVTNLAPTARDLDNLTFWVGLVLYIAVLFVLAYLVLEDVGRRVSDLFRLEREVLQPLDDDETRRRQLNVVVEFPRREVQ